MYKFNGLWLQICISLILSLSDLFNACVNKIRETGDEASANIVYKTKKY